MQGGKILQYTRQNHTVWRHHRKPYYISHHISNKKAASYTAPLSLSCANQCHAVVHSWIDNCLTLGFVSASSQEVKEEAESKLKITLEWKVTFCRSNISFWGSDRSNLKIKVLDLLHFSLASVKLIMIEKQVKACFQWRFKTNRTSVRSDLNLLDICYLGPARHGHACMHCMWIELSRHKMAETGATSISATHYLVAALLGSRGWRVQGRACGYI